MPKPTRYNPIVKAVQFTLDRPRNLIFDANCYAAFDDKTGRFFLPIILKLQKTVAAAAAMPGNLLETDPIAGLEVWLREVSVSDIRALIWAAQAYESDALTLEEAGSYLVDLRRIFEATTIVIQGISLNQPRPGEELPVEPTDDSGDARPTLPPPANNGGEDSGPLLVST